MDSAAAIDAFAAMRPRLAVMGVAGIPLRAGDRARVMVMSASTTRCERVATSEAVDTVALTEVGTCRGAQNYGVGAIAVLGPAARDGALRVYLPLAAGGAGLGKVIGTYPSYTVRLDDGLFDGDFDDVILNVRVLEGPRLRVTCSDVAERGSSAACAAYSTDPAAALEVAEWRFDGQGKTIAETTASTEWGGTMAVGGIVTVRGRVAGREMTARDTISVAARAWPDVLPPAVEQADGCAERSAACPLLHPAADFGDVGRTTLASAWSAAGRLARVPSGPNAGWTYVAGAAPVVTFPSRTVHLNRMLFDAGDAFWAAHPECGIDSLRAWARAHQARHAELLARAAAMGSVNASVEGFAAYAAVAEAAAQLQQLVDASLEGWVRDALDGDHERGGYPAPVCEGALASSEEG
jgi:hypothetical protein